MRDCGGHGLGGSSHGGAVDAVVVGGGIVGTAAASFLAEAGASVVLVEGVGLASAASGANSGVVQHPFDPVLVALYQATLEEYRDLAAADAGFRLPDAPAGMLFAAESEAPARAVEASLAGTFPGLETAVLGGADLVRLDPAVGPGLWACLVQIGYPVAPGASTYAYATLAERRGARLGVGHAATIVLEGDRAVGVEVDGRLVAAGAVLVAAGPWTPGILDPGGRWRPIRPVWGVVVEADLPVTPRHVLEEAGIDAAIGSSPDGGRDEGGPAGREGVGEGVGEGGLPPIEFSLVPQPVTSAVGSTFLEAEPRPTAWIERILSRAARFVPGVADAPIRGTRACPRPQSADGRPLVGRVPGRRDLYVCAGHGPWGISTGPASARLAVDLLLGGGATLPPELDPARFGPPG